MTVNHFAEAFAWCMLQVTLFSLAATCLYGIVVRLRLGGGSAVLIASLAAVGLLTIFCISPWPQWDLKQRDANPGRIIVVSDDSRVMTGSGLRDFEWETAANQSGPGQDRATGRTLADTFFADNSATESGPPSLPPWPVILVAVAGIATVAGLSRLFVGALYLRRYCRRSRPIDDSTVCELFEELARKFALRRRVEVRESGALRAAATAGWRRPIVLLPAEWWQWSPNQLRAVLAHELAHVAQRHFPVLVLSQLPLVAHYYHPLVHWLVRRLRLEQELAADALAASAFGRRRQYVSVLAGLALSAPAPRGPVATLGLFMSRPLLMRRIAMLRQSAEHNGFSRKSRTFALLLLGLAAASAAGLRSSHADESKKPTAVTARPAERVDQPSNLSPAETTATTTPSLAPPTLVAPYVPGELQRRPGAVALFQVSRTPPSLANTESDPESDQAWQVLCKTQLAKLKSHFVLSSALRKPEIAALPLVRAQSDPSDWLAEQLEVGFVPGSEIMYVRLSGKRDDVPQFIKLVDAVSEAYEDEVIFSDRAQQLTTRDLLAQSLKKVNEELTDKMQLYYDMAKELGKFESGGGSVAQEIALKRLDRIETELMRLENALLELETSGQAGNRSFYEERIAELRKRQKELEESIMVRSETSVALTNRSRELEQLQRISDAMSLKLELLDIEANAPARIKKLQPAVPTGIGAPATPMPEATKAFK